jgi:hypothetical protein
MLSDNRVGAFCQQDSAMSMCVLPVVPHHSQYNFRQKWLFSLSLNLMSSYKWYSLYGSTLSQYRFVPLHYVLCHPQTISWSLSNFSYPRAVPITDCGKFYCGFIHTFKNSYTLFNPTNNILHYFCVLWKCVLNVILQIFKDELSPLSFIMECMAIATWFLCISEIRSLLMVVLHNRNM